MYYSLSTKHFCIPTLTFLKNSENKKKTGKSRIGAKAEKHETYHQQRNFFEKDFFSDKG
jgi:hypothetical protein